VRLWPLILAAAIGLGGAALFVPHGEDGAAVGARLYQANCAACHGVAREGQAKWWEVGKDGLLPAPPLDGTGHLWQHSDADIAGFIADGMAAVAPKGYRSAMPAFRDRLTGPEREAILAYLKSAWPPGVRAYQASQNPGGPPLSDLKGDWHFPPDCTLRFAEVMKSQAK
jgi:mono/diheme cytochrome c family protein